LDSESGKNEDVSDLYPKYPNKINAAIIIFTAIGNFIK
jgi:hypothetical protein